MSSKKCSSPRGLAEEAPGLARVLAPAWGPVSAQVVLAQASVWVQARVSGLGQASAQVRVWGRARVGPVSAQVRGREQVRVSERVEVSGLGQVSAQVQASATVGALEQGQASEGAWAWEPVRVGERPVTEVRALLEPVRLRGRPEPQGQVQATANRTAPIG